MQILLLLDIYLLSPLNLFRYIRRSLRPIKQQTIKQEAKKNLDDSQLSIFNYIRSNLAEDKLWFSLSKLDRDLIAFNSRNAISFPEIDFDFIKLDYLKAIILVKGDLYVLFNYLFKLMYSLRFKDKVKFNEVELSVFILENDFDKKLTRYLNIFQCIKFSFSLLNKRFCWIDFFRNSAEEIEIYSKKILKILLNGENLKINYQLVYHKYVFYLMPYPCKYMENEDGLAIVSHEHIKALSL